MLKILNKLLFQEEIIKEPVGLAVIMALKLFVEDGGKISDLSWFQGLGLERIEERDRLGGSVLKKVA